MFSNLIISIFDSNIVYHCVLATHDSHTDYQLYHLARQHAPPPPPAYPGGSVAPGPIVVATPPPTTYPVQPAYPSQQPPVATYPPTEQPLAPGHCRVLGREGNCVTIPNFFACFRASGVLAPDIMRCPLAQACCLRNFF